METKKLLEDLKDTCYSNIQEHINKFYKINGKIEKIKGRVEGRKILSKMIVGIDLTVNTDIWHDEECGIRYFQDELTFLEEQIKEEIEKIKLLETIIKKGLNKEICDEYDFIISSLQHGTSYAGKSDNEIENHNKVINWIKERKTKFENK
jgi:hypothetical protein